MTIGHASSRTTAVTTYDVLKSAAVILMIIDHLGYYFFPDQLWLRAVGRLCVPIWLFLIGYARSRRIDIFLIGGIGVLLAVDAALANNLLPINILGTILLIRLTLNPLMRLIGDNDMSLVIATVFLTALNPLLMSVWEYGGIAVILAMSGYLARHNFQGSTLIPRLYGGLSYLLFVYISYDFFHFSLPQGLFLVVGCAIIFAALFLYLPRQDVIGFRPFFSAPLLQFMSRHTLVIYVVHLIVLKTLHAFLCGCTHCTCRLGFNPLSLIA